MRFINDKNGRIKITAIAAPQNEFTSLLDAFEKTLAHEIEVSKRFYDLMNLALEEKEYSTKNFLQWFVDEQVEGRG